MPREPSAVKDATTDARLGVLVANLGTPDAPTPEAIKRYLGEFLADPMVIDLPRWFWLPLLHGVILNLRPRKVAHAYAKVWTDQGSPLMFHSRAQAEALALALAPRLPGSRVGLGMRYGNPSLRSAPSRSCGRGARRGW